MKRVIPAFIAILLIAIILSGYLQTNGYRVIKEQDGSLSFGIPKTESELVKKYVSSNVITISENGEDKSYTYSKAGVLTLLTGIEYGNIVCDMTGLTISYSLPLDSVIFKDIDETRTEYSVGELAFDDEYNLIIEGASDSNMVDRDALYTTINQGVKSGEDILVKLEDYYVDFSNDVERDNMKKSIKKYDEFHIKYSNGFDLNSKVLAKRKLIKLNDDGTYTVKVDVNTCRDIAGKNLTGYNTIGLTRDFTTHDGRNIKVKSETFGSYIDYQKEGEYLVDAIINFKSEEDRVPIWKQSEEFPMDKTYVELDKENQHFYYYVDGRLVLDTDCVTGLPTARRDTPEGIYFIINKARNANLVGETWDVEVEYWLGVTYSGVGFHDASWRNRFGGNIWKNNGSHGCINTPTDAMKDFYEMVEVGTAVIIY